MSRVIEDQNDSSDTKGYGVHKKEDKDWFNDAKYLNSFYKFVHSEGIVNPISIRVSKNYFFLETVQITGYLVLTAPNGWCDKSRFTRHCDSHRVFIWKGNGARFHPSYLTKIDRFGGKGILVCGGIMLGSRIPLYFFDDGTVNSQRYCQTGPTSDIMVWGGIRFDHMTPLKHIDDNLTGDRFVIQVVEPVVAGCTQHGIQARSGPAACRTVNFQQSDWI
ncbi:hypothetical protein TNCV_2458851 [Trichonephila clavipes]|nr:hypothetical protein TNCV_2458851 [Trichonephila clavipes]